MLIACQKCRRQYDVGAFPEGSRVRCACGELNTVPKAGARRVEMLHCSNCGGRLRESAKTCDYCSAEIELADRGLGPACPECLANTFAGAKYCASCGVRLEVEAVLRALSDRPCPRCKQALSECESAELRYVECTHCGGLWLDEELFERIVNTRDARATAEVRARASDGTRLTAPEVVSYLPCPVCKELMNRRNFAHSSGVILDWCRGHGWWFDASELERVMAFVERGGLERARAAQHERELQELRAERERKLTLPVPHVVPAGRRWTLFDALVDVLLY